MAEQERFEVKLSFTGTYDQKVDAKSRMSIPAELRRVLEVGDPQYETTKITRIAILYGPHLKSHLRAYTISDFERLALAIQKMPRGTAEQRNTARVILGYSKTIEVDRDGRVILPRDMREKIDLGREVQYIGLGEYFEIWNKAATEDHDDALLDWLNAQGDDFDPVANVPELDTIVGGGI